MAEVWAADAEGRRGFTKAVAIKVMLEAFGNDREHERLFVREAQIASRLSHANLVSVIDFDQVAPDDKRFYIAMEMVEGVDLGRMLRRLRERRQALPSGLALHIAGEAL